MNRLDNKKYYEIHQNWEQFKIDAGLQQKIDLVHEFIPTGVNSILDVGCGNGLITNSFMTKFNVLALDRSFSALQFVSAPKVNSQADLLPIKSASVVLVFCSELLEHLDDKTLKDSIDELQRVAKSYLMISVPNQELLAKNALKCPQCSTIFNVSYHYQSFNPERLRNLFPEFACTDIREVGPGWRRYVPFLLKIRQRWGNGWFKIPSTRKVMCPNCENTDFPPFKMNPIILVCDGINKFLSPRRPYWLVALYERKIDFSN